MSSVKNYSAPMPFDCDLSYSSTLEILKYLGTIAYLVPGCVLHFLILRSILVTRRDYFKSSSFFNIFALDSVASIIMILLDVFFGRLFLYVPPLCPIVGPYFWNPSMIPKLYYYAMLHARFSKAVAQIFMVLNRMTCVLVPTYYTGIWNKLTHVAVAMILVVPFGGTWFLFLTPRFYLIPSYGGFAVIYVRTVAWATVSMYQSVYYLTALGFTVVCTSITLYSLILLRVRVKAAEKSLCFSSCFISFTFLLVAGCQLLYILCEDCRTSQYLYSAQYLAFDTFTVGSALILVLSNGQLRESIFSSGDNEDRVFRVSTNNSFTH